MITLKNICKSYQNLEVLHNVSLTIGEKEIITIAGPSGAGKTTLLQIAGTLDKPTSGSVVYDGADITSLNDSKLSRFRNDNIGFVFQFHQLLPEFTALQNVALPALIGGVSKKEAYNRAEELLALLRLSDRLRHKPSQMSGGECQRTAIARALINRPGVIFADEPTGSLDSRNRDEIQEIFAQLRDTLGQTFVIVTHDPTMTECADRVIDMADGRIIDIRDSSAAGSDRNEAPETEDMQPS